MASANVTVNMPPEMLREIDDAIEQADAINSRAEYLRMAIRDSPVTPVEGRQLSEVLDSEENRTGVA